MSEFDSTLTDKDKEIEQLRKYLLLLRSGVLSITEKTTYSESEGEINTTGRILASTPTRRGKALLVLMFSGEDPELHLGDGRLRELLN